MTHFSFFYFSFFKVLSTSSPILTFIRKSSTVARREPIFSEENRTATLWSLISLSMLRRLSGERARRILAADSLDSRSGNSILPVILIKYPQNYHFILLTYF